MILSHYCSNAAFVSIASNRVLWASSLEASNDRYEGRWITQIIQDQLLRAPRANRHVERLMPIIEKAMEFNLCCGFCFSEEEDKLSQWRGYADDGHGVSLGFDLEYLKSLGLKYRAERSFSFSVSPVVYDRSYQAEKVETRLGTIIDRLDQGAFADESLLEFLEVGADRVQQAKSSLILSVATLMFDAFDLKSPDFSEEKEWRLIVPLADRLCRGVLKFRLSGPRIIPYIPIELLACEIQPLRQVVLGPKNGTTIRDMNLILDNAGFKSVEVRRSACPYR